MYVVRISSIGFSPCRSLTKAVLSSNAQHGRLFRRNSVNDSDSPWIDDKASEQCCNPFAVGCGRSRHGTGDARRREAVINSSLIARPSVRG